MQNESADKIVEFIAHLNKPIEPNLSPVLPDSKLRHTSPIKIIKPREVQIQNQANNIKKYLKEEAEKETAILPSMKPVFASLKDADGLAKVSVRRGASTLAGPQPPESSGSGAEKEHAGSSRHLASKLITVSTSAMQSGDKNGEGVALFGRKHAVIQPVLKNTESPGINTNQKRSAFKSKDNGDSPTIRSNKSKMEVKIKSNLRDGSGRTSFKVLGMEKQVSFDVR